MNYEQAVMRKILIQYVSERLITTNVLNRVIHSLYKVGRNGNIGISRFKNTK